MPADLSLRAIRVRPMLLILVENRDAVRTPRPHPVNKPSRGSLTLLHGHRSNSSYNCSTAAPATVHENSCSTILRAAAPIAGNRSDCPIAPLMAAASADASPGGTSHPLTPGRTLSGRPPAVVATTGRRCAIASSVTNELPS